MTKLIRTKPLMVFVQGLKNSGVDVTHDKVAGTVVATDEGVTVLRAIQKGKDHPWLATFRDGGRVKWK